MAAATLAEFTTYLPRVMLTVDGTDYTFPIWNLNLTVQPWSGGVGPAQRLADGRIRQKVLGWHVLIAMDMNFSVVSTTGHSDATSAIQSMYNVGVGVLDLDPVDNPGDRVLTLTMKEGEGMAAASFAGKIRNRRFAVEMITQTVLATGAIPSWIAGDPTP